MKSIKYKGKQIGGIFDIHVETKPAPQVAGVQSVTSDIFQLVKETGEIDLMDCPGRYLRIGLTKGLFENAEWEVTVYFRRFKENVVLGLPGLEKKDKVGFFRIKGKEWDDNFIKKFVEIVRKFDKDIYNAFFER